jgi:DNA-binding MarR family transcriptional regulator
MSNSDIDRFIEDTAGRIGLLFRTLSFGLKKRLCKLNIGPHHMKVLFLLCSLEEAPTISKISRTLAISLAMMTRIIDRLEEKKLVTRNADPDDRRAIRIALTDKGRKIAHELESTKKRKMKALLESFSEEDRQRFMEALRALIGVIQNYEETKG